MADESNVEELEEDTPVSNAAAQQIKFPPLELESMYDMTVDKIASRLLKDNFILTALELHAELLESGKELPRLRDYFSNPGNFEKHSHTTTDVSPVLPRTSSVQTFDSLDFTRYSDDGEKQSDEKVAVLEFELRKARETIKNLRANLTIVTESEPNTPDDGSVNTAVAEDPVRPHERRAVNFLVNEYLLKHNYKLTSITFSDENEDQDFEDWDDVGLNIPKPPDLLYLYRNYSKHMRLWNDAADAEVQTDDSQEQKSEAAVPSLDARNTESESLIVELQSHVQRLRQENMVLTEELTKALSSAAASMEESSLEMAIENPMETTEIEETNPPPPTAKSPTRKSLIEGQGDSNEDESGSQKADKVSPNDELLRSKEVTTTAVDSTKLQVASDRGRCISSSFLNELLSLGLTHCPIRNTRLASDVMHVAQNGEEVILLLARCLPHIVPNVLLTKREELVPLLLAAVALHPEAKVRDALLHLLFNLTKRPDDDQRHVILTGLLTIARCLGYARVEAELLPQCWEQISHKCMERRLLVAESCGHLASHVAAEICSSLLLSMLQQMLREERHEMVRETAARSLAVLLAYVEDKDKFSQAVELALTVIRDEANDVSQVGHSVLLPSVAYWALELGRLETDLLPALMQHFEENFVIHSKRLADGSFGSASTDEQHSVHFIKALESMLPYLLVNVLQSSPFGIVNGKSSDHPKVTRLLLPPNRLLDPIVIMGDGQKVAQLVQAFDDHIDKEWYRTWHAFDWVVTKFIPFLTRVAAHLEIQSKSAVHALSHLLTSFCYLFGWSFTHTKVKPAFRALIPVCREEADGAVATNVKLVLTKATAAVFICGVLTTFSQEEGHWRELASALQDLLCTASFCHASLAGIQYIFSELCSNASNHELLLSVLWDGVVHSSASMRANTARLLEPLVGVVGDDLLENRVFPALVTLASDPELSVRVGSVRSLGAILALISSKELLDKAYMQLQTFLTDAMHQADHSMLTEIIHVFTIYGPNADPRIKDEFIIPRLATMAAQNNQNTCEANRKEVTTLLVEAYTAMSCTFIPEQLVCEAFLPGLRCVHEDVRHICPDHEAAVASMVQEFESKLDFTRERAPLLTSPMASMEEMRRKMSKIFTSPPANARANLPNIFQLRKK